MSIKRIFKPEINNSGGYKGGKALNISEETRKVYKLSSNENILGSVPSSSEILDHHSDSLNIYPAPTPQPLYDALAIHYRDDHLTDQHFIAGNGGSDLLQLITSAFLGRGTNCIISNPCFAPYQMFSSWAGATIKDVPLLEPDFILDVQGILSAIDDQTRVIFLTSPNNPTGTYIPKKEVDCLVHNIPEHVVIVFDEVYHHFTDAADYTRAISYVNEGHSVIAINSFSKAYGLAGLRVGYGYSTPEISAYIRKLIRPFLINDVSLHAAIRALNDKDFLENTVACVQEQKAILSAGLDALGLVYWPSQGNFILMKSQLSPEEFADQMFKNNIMVRPAANFGAPGCVRITIGDEPSTQATLAALATIFK